MTEAALLAAILDAPEDDAPRLIYSDWLLNQGQDERAEFIRVQCRIAAIQATCSCGGCVGRRGGGQHTNGGCAVDKERETLPSGRSRQAFLRRRERELTIEFGPVWHSEFEQRAGIKAPTTFPVDFHRGFVHSITCTAADLRAYGDKIIAPVPLPEVILPSWQPVEEVTLTTWPLHDVSVTRWEVGFTENIRLVLKDRWPRVKNWNLPSMAIYSNYQIGPPVTSDEIVEERQETQRSQSHDIR